MYIHKKEDFDQKDLNILGLIEVDELFQKILVSQREKLDLTQAGLPFKKTHIEEALSWKQEKFDILLTGARLFIYIFRLPPCWIETAIFLILFDTAVRPNRELYPSIEIELPKSTPSVLNIVIKEAIKTPELIGFLEENKKRINSALAALPGLQTLNVESIETMKQTLTLQREKLSDSDIVKKLSVKNTTAPRQIIDYYNIPVQRYRVKKHLQKLLKTKGFAQLEREILLQLNSPHRQG